MPQRTCNSLAFAAFMPPENFALRPLVAFASGWPEDSSPLVWMRNARQTARMILLIQIRKLGAFECVPQAQDATRWFRSAVISQAPGAGASVQPDLTISLLLLLMLFLLPAAALLAGCCLCYWPCLSWSLCDHGIIGDWCLAAIGWTSVSECLLP